MRARRGPATVGGCTPGRAACAAHAALAVATLTLAGIASAQIGAEPGRLLEALGHEPETLVDDAFRTASGVEVRLQLRGGALHTVRGSATLGEDALEDVASVVAAATGLGDAIAGPVADFLRARVPELAGAGQVVIGVERFRLTLDVAGDEPPYEVAFGLALAEIEEAAFPEARHVLGDGDAPIVVREFSDFQCPFCRRFVEEVLPDLEEGVLAREDVRFEYHHFPLQSIHANAFRAAEASECAADAAPDDEGAFWRYHDALFESQAAWSGLADPDEYLAGLADAVDLDASSVAACLETGARRSTVQNAYDAAVGLQLRGTPTVFVNGFQLEDFTSLEAYRETIALVEAFRGGPDADAD